MLSAVSAGGPVEKFMAPAAAAMSLITANPLADDCQKAVKEKASKI